MLHRNNNIKLICGTSNPELGKEISRILRIPLTKVDIEKFSNSETYVRIKENMRGKDVFIIQSTSTPTNDNLMELLITIDAVKRASADNITVVMPWYGYSKQDRKAASREPISAKLVANLLTIAGANRIVTVDLHASQIQGFFDIPVDNLYAMPILAKHFQKKNLKNFVIVSPDEGGVKINSKLASKLRLPLVVISKERSYELDGHDKVQKAIVLGDMKGRDVIMMDDMIMTGGTVTAAVKILKENGAGKIYLAFIHGDFAGPAMERMKDNNIEEIVVTNSIKFDNNLDKIKIVSISPLLAEAIKRIHLGESVSSLFE